MAARVRVLRLPPGVSGQDFHGRPVCRMMPAAKIDAIRRAGQKGARMRALQARCKDPYAELGL